MNFRRKTIDDTVTSQPKNEKSITRLLKLSIWLLIIFSGILYYNYKSFSSQILNQNERIISITSGDAFSNLDKKLWFESMFYKFYIKQNTPNFDLQEARYKIPKDATIDEILESLKTPITPEEINITLLEGWNIFDIDLALTNKWLINAWEYISYVENKQKIIALTEFFPFLEWLITLEWFLYPDTYTIDTSSFKINQFVILQLETFENKVYNKIFTQLTTNQVHDVVNLASIVEKEERNPKEKASVAGILKKRLNADWNIGADITVCYPHRLTSQECKLVVSKYIREKSEYNTRTKIWLPKTPIGNPNYETIFATLNHKQTPYWYYLHNIKSGKIYYGKTNAQHEANKKYMY